MNKIELIKKLRNISGGISISYCRLALEKINVDLDKTDEKTILDKAIIWLREEGKLKSIEKNDRIATDGLIKILTNNNKSVILELNCETDFVAKNKKFNELADKIANIALNDDAAINNFNYIKEKTNYLLTDAIMAFGEKIILKRLEIIIKNENEVFGKYIHLNNKIGSLVIIDKNDIQLANKLTTHIVANNPKYICFENIPKNILENEKNIFLKEIKNDEKFKNKPDLMINKIVDGKLRKSFDDITLYEQMYLYDNTKKVYQILIENKVHVIKMIRYQIGDNIE